MCSGVAGPYGLALGREQHRLVIEITEHAAYPLLTALYVGKKYPKTIPVLVLYVLGVWIAVMYLGEHYFFDVVLGAIYAMFVYASIQRLKKYLQRRKLPAGT